MSTVAREMVQPGWNEVYPEHRYPNQVPLGGLQLPFKLEMEHLKFSWGFLLNA